MRARPGLSELGLGPGKKARLHRILNEHGLGNGTAIFLPYDQGLEHGPRDFFANPAASDPTYIIKLAVEGGFNGIAIQIGLAEKFFWDYAGEVPLVLKLNGKTEIPAIDPLSPVNASLIFASVRSLFSMMTCCCGDIGLSNRERADELPCQVTDRDGQEERPDVAAGPWGRKQDDPDEE